MWTSNPNLHKRPNVLLPNPVAGEATPVSFNGRLLLVMGHRAQLRDKIGTSVRVYDYFSKELLAEHPWPHGLVSALVDGPDLRVFGTEDWSTPGNAVFTTTLDANFAMGPTSEILRGPADRMIYNTSVCHSPNGYTMAFEVDEPGITPFSGRFATSPDLITWTEIGDVMHPTSYAACPTIRYHDGWYYVLYLRHVSGRFVTFIGRTQTFIAADWKWFHSNATLPHGVQVLASASNEGINNSDVDLCEYNGITHFVYADGDQATWGNLRTAVYLGTMADFFKEYWP